MCIRDSSDAAPEFTWSAVTGAEAYDLWVRDLTGGTDQVIRETDLATNSHTPAEALTVGHSYRWWVRVSVNGVWSPWSAGRTFNVTE